MFLRGTQLEDLKNDYFKLKTTVDKLGKLLEDKKQITPDLESQLRSAKQRLKEMQAAVSLERKIDSLKRQIAWSQVYDKEDAARKEQDNFEIASDKLRAAQVKSDEAKKKYQQLEVQYEELDAQIKEYTATIKPIEDAHEEKRAEFRDMQKQLRKVDVSY
jgi:septal ring factor EnvC (AmiA/AmiB activator)